MRRLIATFIALGTLGAAAAPPRIALVRITDLYKDLPSTKAEIAGFDAQRADVLKDRRADEIRKLVEELKALQASIQKEGDASDPTRQKLLKDYESKVSAMKSLQQEFETFSSERNLEINREMVKTMRVSFDRITKQARAVAEKQGYDWLIDSSGNTNTGLPVVLYSKNAPDLTADVLAALSGQTSQNTPPEAPTAAPAAPATPASKPPVKPVR
ncbi:OmpH family outer membrane protein [Luteolibacter sp. LG18]|uniref:OmpH family outer membrane protein n=1 Tax=Luteolibacter sp. LG18 TaxID=2819286 RepID=UPI002B2C952B|nr:hypothetical protein llg_16970 [Luteolibacter sp. LG18]